MHIYTVSTGCYSDYTEIILVHEKEFTEDEFLEMCKTSLEIASRLVATSLDYRNCLEETLKVLAVEYGFQSAKYLNCYLYDYESGAEPPKIYNQREKSDE